MKTFNTLIIGCGNIAGGYDSFNTNSKSINTHAKAYQKHSGFSIDGCVDPNQIARDSFSKQWGIKRSYASLSEALEDDIKYDVVSLCSPSDQHLNDLNLLLDAQPKLIFCEKPITENLIKTKEIVKKCQNLGISLAVNHIRRWDEDLQNFKMELSKGKWGRVHSAVGYYNKGILNNGTHLVDLMQYVLGKITLVSIGTPVVDYSNEDPTIPAILFNKKHNINIHFSAGNANDYTIFEIHFMMENGFVSIEDSGRIWRKRLPINSKDFFKYKFLNQGDIVPKSNSFPMFNAISNIYNHLSHGENLSSTGFSALSSQHLCEEIKLSL